MCDFRLDQGEKCVIISAFFNKMYEKVLIFIVCYGK